MSFFKYYEMGVYTGGFSVTIRDVVSTLTRYFSIINVSCMYRYDKAK